jgi:outer membrane protein assembly factor BamB
MTRIYIRRELYEDAVGFYKELGTEFANVVVRDGKTGADLLNELFTDKRFLPYLESHGLSWRGTFKSEERFGSSNIRETSMTVVPEGDLLPFFERHRLVLDTNTMGGNTWTLRLLDRATTEERWKQPNLPAAFYFTGSMGGTNFVNLGGGQVGVLNAQGAIIQVMQGNVGNNPTTTSGLQNHRFAFAKGHTLVLHLNNMVFAYDLAERKEVWRYNLYGQNPILGNTQNFPQIDADGKVVVTHVNDGRLERIGGVAVVESSYVCLQGRVTDELNGGSREGLIALDPNRPGPSVLWTKSDVSFRAQVFGDDQHVYIVEPGGGNVPPRVRALRAQDGVTVPVTDFGALYARKIRTLGRCLLLHEDEPQGGKVVRLYDVQTGQDVWRKSFSAGALPIRSEDPALAGAVEKDHSATFLDARTGRVLFKTMLQAEHVERLHEVAAVSDRNHIYLALTRTPENGTRWTPYVSNGMRSLSLNGPLYALDRTSGKLDWVCDFLQYQTLLLEQMHDLPLLLFTSQYSKTAPNGNMQQSEVRVTGVDKRTGKLLYDNKFAQSTVFQALHANPVEGKIELVRQDLKITFTAVHSPAGQSGAPPSIR